MNNKLTSLRATLISIVFDDDIMKDFPKEIKRNKDKNNYCHYPNSAHAEGLPSVVKHKIIKQIIENQILRKHGKYNYTVKNMKNLK